jgi:DNA helicase-2/ATP-dependent DNA helicase PcrA
MFKPTPAQEQIINHYDGHALVIAGPGSGKTTTLIAHVKSLILEKNVPPANIWVMAFNRDIASKLEETLDKDLGGQAPQATTIHTFILLQSKEHVKDLLDNSEIADSLGECGKELLIWRPIANRLSALHGIKKTTEGKRLDIRHVKGSLWNQLRDYWLISESPQSIGDDLFEKYRQEVERCKRIYGIIFLDELALRFYEAIKVNPSLRREVAVPRVVIDEFQDLNPTEHGIIQQFSEAGTTFTVFGDDDQAINDFRRAHADYIRQFQSVYAPKEYSLPRDRRCPKQILQLADDFVRGLVRLPKPSGFAGHDGRVDILNFEDDEAEKNGVAKIVNKYLSLSSGSSEPPEILILCGPLGTIKGRPRTAEFIETLKKENMESVTGEVKENPLDNEWGLAFQSVVRMVMQGLSAMNLAAFVSVAYPNLLIQINTNIESEERKGNPIDFRVAFDKVTKDNSEIEKLLADILALKPSTATTDFDLEKVIGLVPRNLRGREESEPIIRKIWDDTQRNENPQNKSDAEKGDAKSIKALQQAIGIFTGDIRKPEIGRIHVTTYRKAKGLEADLVIVTSADSRDFYDGDQMRRLLYVAATRAKKNLVLTFASKKTKARIYARGRDAKSRGNPNVIRSILIPARYSTDEYSEEWLANWEPIL